MRLEHVDFRKRTIFVKGKSGERQVFFSSAARTWLLRYLAGRESGYLFESRHRVQRGCVSWNGKGWVGYWLDYRNRNGERRQRSIYLGRPRSMGCAEALRRFKKLVPNPDEGHQRRKPHTQSLALMSLQFSKRRRSMPGCRGSLAYTTFATLSRLTCSITAPISDMFKNSWGTLPSPVPTSTHTLHPSRSRPRTESLGREYDQELLECEALGK